MRVLVTGGCGFIGSEVIRRGLREIGASIFNVDKLTYAAMPDALAEVNKISRYSFRHGDICDRSFIDNVFDDFAPEAVIHLAAESHVDRSINGPAEFIHTNLVGTYTLLEAARCYWVRLGPAQRRAFRFLHVSTDEVYGSLDISEPPFVETTPYLPRSPYSASKAGSDHLARAWAETYGLPVIITNCSNNYGPWQFPEKLIPVMIINAREQKPLPVYGTGCNVRDWLHVADHARALWDVMCGGEAGETYNIGGGMERANIDVVRDLCRLMDARCPHHAPHGRLIEFAPDRPGHDLRYAVDASKIHRELGWQPRVAFEHGLAATVDWYLAHEGWWRGIRDSRRDDQSWGIAEQRQGAAAR